MLACLLSTHSEGKVNATQKGDIFTLENEHMRLTVNAAAGARITSWSIKPGNRELIALWKGRSDIGGALDDRAFFTAARYKGAVMHPGPDSASLRFDVSHPSGLSIVKWLDLKAGSPALLVRTEFRNGTQVPRRLFVRNFFLPGHHPQTEEHLYWVGGKEERRGTVTTGSTTAAGYYLPGKQAYAALWDRSTGDGILALAPGVSKWYFWRGSKEFPTFEWLYEDIPAGKVLHAEVRLVVIADPHPDIPALAQRHRTGLHRASTTPLAGWVDENTRFGVTPEERQRGFWLSTGTDPEKRRLPTPFALDLARDDGRTLSVTLNLLRDLHGKLSVVPLGNPIPISCYLQTDGADRRELRPIPATDVSWTAGDKRTLWFQISSAGLTPGVYQQPVRIAVGQARTDITLRLRVWDVRLDPLKPFHVRGYCGGFPVWTAGYEVNEYSLRHLEAILKAFAAIGGDVVDWNAVWARILNHTKLATTGESIVDVAKNSPESINLDALPKLDFSYYDPWFDLAKHYGVTRVETYMTSPANPQLSWRLLAPALGKNRVKPGTPEARTVLIWFYREMKRYFEERGFNGFFCKINDEISPEHIPDYITVAGIARQAGWRPFTTITGMIARTATHLNSMNPHCDQWQLGFGSKDDFLALNRERYVIEHVEYPLPQTWRPYTNGGARHTWGMKTLGESGAVKVSPGAIETFEVLEDGVPLRKKGGSPWGNQQRGVVITGGRLHEILYLSPRDGSPEDHAYTLKLLVKKPSKTGTPLVTLDPEDEIWCYGGGSRPYRGTYANAWCYPLMTLFHGFQGYGLWAFYHWNKTERIIWIDPKTCAVTVSPAYCGYRDGWRDACLLAQVRKRKPHTVDQKVVLGEDKNAILRVSTQHHEVYTFKTIARAGDPVVRNEARRRALADLAGK